VGLIRERKLTLELAVHTVVVAAVVVHIVRDNQADSTLRPRLP